MPKRGPKLGAYAVSKAAQNAMTVKVAAALAGTPVLVNAVARAGSRPIPGPLNWARAR